MISLSACEFCTDFSWADRDARRKSWRKNEEGRGNEKEMRARVSNPFFRGLKSSSCTLLGEYRLSVVHLGVLHSSKYLGIFEESRVPKKTVYSVRRDPSEGIRTRRAWNSHRQRLSSTIKHASIAYAGKNIQK